MARHVKISVVGPQRPAGDPGTGQAAVDRMIDFWRAKLDQVLPESPDLVVVPENCDSYRTHSIEDRLLYYAAREDQVLDLFSERSSVADVRAAGARVVSTPLAQRLEEGAASAPWQPA